MGIYRQLIMNFSCFPNSFSVITVATLCFGIPIYIAMLVVLWRNRKTKPFDSLFYRLVFILGILDVLTVSNFYIFIKFPAFGFFLRFYENFLNMEEVDADDYIKMRCLRNFGCRALAHYANFSTTVLGVLQIIGTTLISLNRFTALAFVTSSRHEMVRT